MPNRIRETNELGVWRGRGACEAGAWRGEEAGPGPAWTSGDGGEVELTADAAAD